MGRPRTELGTWGEITTVGQVKRGRSWVSAAEGEKPQRYRARTKIRDLDGKLRDVERYGPTKTRAEAILKAALRDRATPREGNLLRPTTEVEEAGRIYLKQAKRPESGLSQNTIKQYEDNFERLIVGSSIAGLTLLEANQVPILRAFLQKVADERGTGAAKTAKSLISGILTMAVGDGVLDLNAARQTKPVKAATPRESPRDHERALTRAERQEIIAFAEADEYANKHDIVDVIRWMAGMGSRISETLAQRDEDLTVERVQVDGGYEFKGRAIISGTKSPNSVDRPVDLPAWLAEDIWNRRQRLGKAASGYTFASVRTGTRRDRHNENKKLRNVLDRAGYVWAVPHSFRRTVATLIDQAGLGVTEAAAVLGQHPHTTSRYYFGKRGDTSRAASVL